MCLLSVAKAMGCVVVAWFDETGRFVGWKLEKVHYASRKIRG